jgi:hypothetical protein
MQIAGADGIGAGLFYFDFYSPTAGFTSRFSFSGTGFGLGGNAAGTLVPGEGPLGPWSSIETDNAFSVNDLHGAQGRLTNLSVGVGIGYGLVYITAAPPWSFSSWFSSQNVGGYGTSTGAGIMTLVGGWEFKSVSGNTPPSCYWA